MKPLNRSFLIQSASAALGIVIVILYIYLYQATPLPAPWNDIALFWMFFLATSLAAIPATLVTLRFRKDDGPRAVWLYFALALWCWAAAELIWAIDGMILDEVPSITLADAFWVGALGLFAWSFVRQYRLLFSTSRRQEWTWLLGVGGASLIVALILTLLLRSEGGQSEQTWYETYLAVFYPVSDLAMALAALYLSHIFGRGLWGRAWWGLLVFAASDALYSWLMFTGIYAVSAGEGNPVSMFADALYISAYLVVGLICMSQWLLLRYGPPRIKVVPLPEVEEA